MGIENAMYLALGMLLAGIVALAILPAVWRRAVRLTKKRIEAATPMTMAEFRADKDQLRAEFALSTRRLEMNVEALRKRLAEQLREINRKKSDISAIKTDRDTHLTVIREMEEREAELGRRVAELEKEGASLGQLLRERDRELADLTGRLDSLREEPRAGLREAPPEPAPVVTPAVLDGRPLSGDYQRDTRDLLATIETARTRLSQLEEQNTRLVAEIEQATHRAAEASAAASAARKAGARSEDRATRADSDLVEAEAHIADAEHRLGTLLVETARIVEEGEERTNGLLAEKLAMEQELEALRSKVSDVESTIMADWDTDRVDQAHLRERLNDIASEVGRLVHAVDRREPPDSESLFDRVQRFAGEPDPKSPPRPPGDQPRGVVSGRLAALRDIRADG